MNHIKQNEKDFFENPQDYWEQYDKFSNYELIQFFNNATKEDLEKMNFWNLDIARARGIDTKLNETARENIKNIQTNRINVPYGERNRYLIQYWNWHERE